LFYDVVSLYKRFCLFIANLHTHKARKYVLLIVVRVENHICISTVLNPLGIFISAPQKSIKTKIFKDRYQSHVVLDVEKYLSGQETLPKWFLILYLSLLG